jgi:transcriptional regulator with XRE-family HTH domain
MSCSSSGLGASLRHRRRELGLSIRTAADRIGISPSYLVALEHGRNPSTDRPPVPSARILAAIGRAYDIELAALLDESGAEESASAHLVLYQAGTGYRSPLEAARRLFAGRVDAWIEITDPRTADDHEAPEDVLLRVRGPLASADSMPHVFEPARVLTALADALEHVPRSTPRLGVIFGANSAVLRSIENPPILLDCEKTWEHEVAAAFRTVLGVGPAANICVYREADLQELAPRLDQLATVLSLVRSHPQVAVQDGKDLVTGAVAIESIVEAARPAGVSSETWESLARAAALGLVREGR